MLEQLLNTGNCICGLPNAASSTVAKRVLTFGSTEVNITFQQGKQKKLLNDYEFS
jgi:hypothetical protein